MINIEQIGISRFVSVGGTKDYNIFMDIYFEQQMNILIIYSTLAQNTLFSTCLFKTMLVYLFLSKNSY